MIHRLNIWYFSSLLISIVVAVPIIIIFSSFFELTSEYSLILKETFLLDYIVNSLVLLIGVIIITSIIGIGCAYLISFYDFPGAKFFKWGLILSFAVPAYIYSYSLTAFFENYGTAYSILKPLFGDGEYNKYIPKLDGMVGATIAISFSIFGGSSFATSLFILRSTNGVTCFLRRMAVESGSADKSFSNSFLPPSKPGIKKRKIVHRSIAVFSIGVPERASLCSA